MVDMRFLMDEVVLIVFYVFIVGFMIFCKIDYYKNVIDYEVVGLMWFVVVWLDGVGIVEVFDYGKGWFIEFELFIGYFICEVVEDFGC